MSFAQPTVAEGWEKFSKIVIPEDAPAEQFREMRKAFYAGAFEVLCDVLTGFDLDRPMSAVRREYVENLRRELLRFVETMLREEGLNGRDFLEGRA